MGKDERYKELDERSWKHVREQDYARAESTIRELIDITDPDDSPWLCLQYGRLGGVLNALSRPSEGTDMYRRALAEARRMADSPSAVDVYRYFLANQYLIFGDPSDALSEAEPVPAGTGHTQCCLHSVCAEALWRLGRRDEARATAQRAVVPPLRMRTE